MARRRNRGGMSAAAFWSGYSNPIRESATIEDARNHREAEALENATSGTHRSNDFGDVRHVIREGRTRCGAPSSSSNVNALDCDDCLEAEMAVWEGE